MKTSLKEEVEKILDKVLAASYIPDRIEREEAKEQLLALFKTKMLEIVGEYEKETTRRTLSYDEIIAMNLIKEEIRQRVEEIA